MAILWPFLAIFGQLFIFNKTEVQMVILRYLTSLNHNWYKIYDTKHKKHKNAKKANEFFFYKSQKPEMEIFAFCVLTLTQIRI